VLADEEQRSLTVENLSKMLRIFFAIPDVRYARRVADELQAAGLDREQMHPWSKSGTDHGR
jgi:hypothetical protein